ncbi:MAG TPA: hypothetical protein VNQ79_04815 [Blastocatellia bacterium]|nr:hypothetical protein [Blastocatellia bacterium]
MSLRKSFCPVSVLLPLVLSAMLLTHAAAQSSSSAARVWQEGLTIPTYELGPPNPYPVFQLLDPHQRRPIYPFNFRRHIPHAQRHYRLVQ